MQCFPVRAPACHERAPFGKLRAGRESNGAMGNRTPICWMRFSRHVLRRSDYSLT
jgi:hypothetical protein